MHIRFFQCERTQRAHKHCAYDRSTDDSPAQANTFANGGFP